MKLKIIHIVNCKYNLIVLIFIFLKHFCNRFLRLFYIREREFKNLKCKKRDTDT